ncbi:hypothetical protein Y032_0041g378 [Ancylostoma ceylanicum]|uniref:Uncharacterized protein n=1 Tax=Ancylostoma ceylanicum TaxID=53326 RepID=A0A016UFS4_9BILA|nr:hypothetical protein Y032_0041g378 [Ancylostoma ceylanicum]
MDKEQQAIRHNATFMRQLGDAEEYAADLKADDISIAVDEDRQENDVYRLENEMQNHGQGRQDADAIQEDLTCTLLAKSDKCLLTSKNREECVLADAFEMPCVFCDAIGQHYSDSCSRCTHAQERIRILHASANASFASTRTVRGNARTEREIPPATTARSMDTTPLCVSCQNEASGSWSDCKPCGGITRK